MMTKSVVIGRESYLVGELTFDQYEQCFYDQSGVPIERPSIRKIVSLGLSNGPVPISAEAVGALGVGTVIRLYAEISELSGLSGKAQTKEAAS